MTLTETRGLRAALAAPGSGEWRRPRLTRRGRIVALVVVVFVVLGWRYGPREMNAVAAPAVAALLVGVVAVWRADCRTVEVNSPRPGVTGETRRVVIDFEGRGLATVGLDLDEGVHVTDDTAPVETTIALPATVEWTVELSDRGLYDIGPLQVRLHGPLGLVERRVERPVDSEVVVYPRRYELHRPAVATGQLHARYDAARQEFEHIREYQPGDPLRRVDWKSSAKHDELHVIEFAAREGRQSVTIAGAAAEGMADEMAQTVATLAESALDAGLDVGVIVPDGRCSPDSGPTHREQLLRLLARTGSSDARDSPEQVDVSLDIPEQEADIVVEAGDPRIKRGPRDTVVRTTYGSYTLSELRAGDGHTQDNDTRTREVNA